MNGRAHAQSNVAGKNITEVAGRYGYLHGTLPGRLLLYPEGSPEVIDDLSKNPGPVDGIHCTKGILALESEVVENFLEDTLSVIKSAFDCEAMDIFIRHGGHLQFLDGADASIRIKDENMDAGLSSHAVNGSASSVAAGGADDIQATALALQKISKQIAKKLQCNIFESKGRPMKKLGQIKLISKLDDRNNVLMAESGIALLNQTAKILSRHGIADKGAHHFEG